jgi:hypothetical protein
MHEHPNVTPPFSFDRCNSSGAGPDDRADETSLTALGRADLEPSVLAATRYEVP